MAEEKKKPKTEVGFNILGLGNLLDGVLGGLGNIEELLNTADRLADAKGDSEAKEKVKKIREGLGLQAGGPQGPEGKTGATKEEIKAEGLGGLFSQILNFVEKASQEGTQEFEIGGRKVVISRGIRIGGLGGPGRQPPEEFEVRRHEPKIQRTKKPVVEEKTQALGLDVFEEENCIKVIGDMPGVSEEDIHYELKEKTLRIYTEGSRKYQKEIELPAPVTGKIDLKYRNGVLEVTLTKRK